MWPFLSSINLKKMRLIPRSEGEEQPFNIYLIFSANEFHGVLDGVVGRMWVPEYRHFRPGLEVMGILFYKRLQSAKIIDPDSPPC